MIYIMIQLAINCSGSYFLDLMSRSWSAFVEWNQPIRITGSDLSQSWVDRYWNRAQEIRTGVNIPLLFREIKRNSEDNNVVSRSPSNTKSIADLLACPRDVHSTICPAFDFEATLPKDGVCNLAKNLSFWKTLDTVNNVTNVGRLYQEIRCAGIYRTKHFSCSVLCLNSNCSSGLVSHVYTGNAPCVREPILQIPPQNSMGMLLKFVQEKRIVHLPDVTNQDYSILPKPYQHAQEIVLEKVRPFHQEGVQGHTSIQLAAVEDNSYRGGKGLWWLDCEVRKIKYRAIPVVHFFCSHLTSNLTSFHVHNLRWILLRHMYLPCPPCHETLGVIWRVVYQYWWKRLIFHMPWDVAQLLPSSPNAFSCDCTFADCGMVTIV